MESVVFGAEKKWTGKKRKRDPTLLMNTQKKSIPTFHCPTSELPEDFPSRGKKRSRSDGQSQQQQQQPERGGRREERERERGDDNNMNKRNKRDNEEEENNEKQLFEKMFKTVKEFGLTNIHNSKRKSLADKLTQLGAPPPKQPTMPFKMKIGILEGRKKREKRSLEEAKQSGQVLAKSKSKPKSAEMRTKTRSQHPDFDVPTRGGVLRLSRSKVPSKFWNK